MKGKRIYLVIALSLIVAVVLINVAYAVTSSVQSDNNSITASERVVDVSMTDAFTVDVPEYASLPATAKTQLSSLTIDADGTVKIRAWVHLDETSDWLILDNIRLTFYAVAEAGDLSDGNVQKYVVDNGFYVEKTQEYVTNNPSATYYTVGEYYDFGITQVDSTHYNTFVPTGIIQKTEGTYSFDLTFSFVGTVGQVLYDTFADSFSGTLTFAMADVDPAPVYVPSP